jgi:hypothetical protein
MKLSMDAIGERCCCLFASANFPSYTNGCVSLRQTFASTVVWVAFAVQRRGDKR